MSESAQRRHPVVSMWAPDGIPEIRADDDLTAILLAAVGDDLLDGDIVVVSSKIISKAEGRMVVAENREQAISDETVRVVATRAHPGGVTRIVENRIGVVQAAAGVDTSNVPSGHVLLLPVDPDGSARAIVTGIRESTGRRIGVIVSDTLGRPWRVGQTDAAIGAAGVRVVDDLRGQSDTSGKVLDVTVPAVADEIAAAADLVKGKVGSRPVAVVRGLGHLVTDLDEPGASALIRPANLDMFRLGSDEAFDQGFAEGYESGYAEASNQVGPDA